MSRTEQVKPRSRWDWTDTGVAVGLTAIVVGLGLFSIAAGLVVAGITLTGLSIIWPKR